MQIPTTMTLTHSMWRSLLHYGPLALSDYDAAHAFEAHGTLQRAREQVRGWEDPDSAFFQSFDVEADVYCDIILEGRGWAALLAVLQFYRRDHSNDETCEDLCKRMSALISTNPLMRRLRSLEKRLVDARLASSLAEDELHNANQKLREFHSSIERQAQPL